MEKLAKGLIAAVFTPFKADQTLKLEYVPDQIDHLLKAGVGGALIAGSTGEGYSLAREERLALAEAWMRHKPAGFPLVVHVGHNALPESRQLARHADEIGADGILLSAPSYFKPATVEDLVEFCCRIVDGIGDTPVYYYHIPSMSGVNFPMVDFFYHADGRIPNFRGLKYTYEDLEDVRRCIEYENGKFELIFGRDELLLAALKLGAKTALGSTYNYMAPLFNAIIDAHEAGEEAAAESLQSEACRIIDVVVKYGGGIVAGKSIMSLLGMDCGPLRLPLRDLYPEKKERLAAELKQTNLIRYSNNPLFKDF